MIKEIKIKDKKDSVINLQILIEIKISEKEFNNNFSFEKKRKKLWQKREASLKAPIIA